MLQAATVRTHQKFTRTVGRNMGEAIRDQLGQAPKACWLFCAPLDGIAQLLQGICEGAGTEMIIGCTSDGEITDAGLSINSAVLAGIVTDDIDFEIFFQKGLGADSNLAGRQVAGRFSSTPKYLQIFSDGITGNGSALLKGIASIVGDHIPICGGAAGDNGQFHQTLQFCGNQIYTDAVCGIAFYGNFQFGTSVRSGWAPIGLAKQVTKACGNIVYELNGEPALNVFERFLGHHAAKLPAIGVEYPLGFTMPAGTIHHKDLFLLRATIAVDRKARSIIFAGDIPEGAMVNLTCGDRESILKAAETAAQEAWENMGGVMPQIAFCYSCMARKIILGRRTEEGIQRVHAQFGSQIPMIGFYSYGEFCPISPGTPSYLHNETITLTILRGGP